MVLLNDISSLVQSSDSCEELKMTEKKLITIKNNLTAFTVEVLSTLPAITGPSNKNVEKQRSFQSFKKKDPARYVLEILRQVFVKRFRQDFLAHRAVKIVRAILAIVTYSCSYIIIIAISSYIYS